MESENKIEIIQFISAWIQYVYVVVEASQFFFIYSTILLWATFYLPTRGVQTNEVITALAISFPLLYCLPKGVKGLSPLNLLLSYMFF